MVRFAEAFCSGVLVYPYSCFPHMHFSLHLYCVTRETRAELHLRVAAISHGFDDYTHSQRPHGYRGRNWSPEFMIGQETHAGRQC